MALRPLSTRRGRTGKMKVSKLIRCCVVSLLLICLSGFGLGYASWVNNASSADEVAPVNVQSWNFADDTDFARAANLRNATNLTVTREDKITQGSNEAIRITNTAGTSTKDHIININFDRDYELSEIQFYKFEFDYYHRYKREQNDRGFPKVQFTINNSILGSEQGGTDTCTSKSSFVSTPIDENWWHLEYYISAHLPAIAGHGDTPVALTKKINGVRINDRTMYDYTGTTSFAVIDNMSFSAEPAPRLGIFNRWTSDAAGKFFWFKVAFSGQLHSAKLYSSDTTLAVPEFDPSDTVSTSYPFPNGSPFYFKLLQPGVVRFTATMEVGDNHDVFTITSDNFTINQAE